MRAPLVRTRTKKSRNEKPPKHQAANLVGLAVAMEAAGYVASLRHIERFLSLKHLAVQGQVASGSGV